MTAMPQPGSNSIIKNRIFVKNTINWLTVEKFFSDPVLFNVVVCHGDIFNFTSGKLAIQRLLK